jgi:hypothetical protein
LNLKPIARITEFPGQREDELMRIRTDFSFLVLLIIAICLVLCCGKNPIKENHAPQITEIIMAPATNIKHGMVVSFSCVATDIDGDQLTYVWQANVGSFESNTGISVKWTAPDSTVLATIDVLANDSKVITQKTFQVQVGRTDLTECNEFADEHWLKDDYTQWLIDSLNITSNTMRYWDPTRQEWAYLQYHLPVEKNDEYYEMIGECDQFRWGWDDYIDYTKTSVHRNQYLECRM